MDLTDSMNAYSRKDRWWFLRHSVNAHGLHSPFVFNFYNDIKKRAKAYRTEERLKSFSKKQSRIIRALIAHQKPQYSLFLKDDRPSENCNIAKLVNDYQSIDVNSIDNLKKKKLKFDLILCDKSLILNRKDFITEIHPLLKNDSLVIIPHIHASKEANRAWKYLLADQKVILSMDLFFLGLLFFRKESSKQDFLLRF